MASKYQIVADFKVGDWFRFKSGKSNWQMKRKRSRDFGGSIGVLTLATICCENGITQTINGANKRYGVLVTPASDVIVESAGAESDKVSLCRAEVEDVADVVAPAPEDQQNSNGVAVVDVLDPSVAALSAVSALDSLDALGLAGVIYSACGCASPMLHGSFPGVDLLIGVAKLAEVAAYSGCMRHGAGIVASRLAEVAAGDQSRYGVYDAFATLARLIDTLRPAGLSMHYCQRVIDARYHTLEVDPNG